MWGYTRSVHENQMPILMLQFTNQLDIAVSLVYCLLQVPSHLISLHDQLHLPPPPLPHHGPLLLNFDVFK